MRTDYDVHITSVNNGIIVNVGCKKLVFKDCEIDEFFADLRLYLTSSNGQAKLYKKYFPDEPRPVPVPEL